MGTNGHNGHKRAVLYARVSGDDRGKEGRNLAGQLDMGRQRCAERNWAIVAELPEDDGGASGASFDLPQLNKVREMAAAREFDVLVVREIDRLSRNLAKQLIVEEELKRHGVQIEYVVGEYADTPEGNLNKQIKAVIAEYERGKIAERVVRGRRLKVKAGSVLVHGHSPYGYRLAQKDGKHRLEIYEPESQIVLLIFTWYANGDGEQGPLSLNDIVRKLTAMGIPTRSDAGQPYATGKKRGHGEWSRSVVHAFLRNETYAGRWRYGKETRQNGRYFRHPEDHHLLVEVPAIISPELWDAVQARITVNRLRSGRKTVEDYLLSKRITCGACHVKAAASTGRYRAYIYKYYRCPAAHPVSGFAHRCDLPTFHAEPVDAAVWQWVRGLLSKPNELRRRLREYQAHRARENQPLVERRSVVRDLLTEQRAQHKRVVDLYVSGLIEKDDLVERKSRLEATIHALEHEDASLSATLEADTLSDERVEEVVEYAETEAAGLEAADEDFQKRRYLIETLDVRATIVKEGEEYVVYATCRLDKKGARLSLSSTNTVVRL
jgi:site-specific DNA recombinase